MDDAEMNDARSEFASLFSDHGASSEEDEGEISQPGEDQDERVLGDERMSVGSGEGSVLSLSITEFVVLAKKLAQNEDAIDVFCKFVLTGVYEGQQYQVDPIKHAMGRSDRIKASRDYDSVLGFGKHIYLDCDITLHPVCKLEDTLRRNIRIKRSFTNTYVRMVLRTRIYFIDLTSTGKPRRCTSPSYSKFVYCEVGRHSQHAPRRHSRTLPQGTSQLVAGPIRVRYIL